MRSRGRVWTIALDSVSRICIIREGSSMWGGRTEASKNKAFGDLAQVSSRYSLILFTLSPWNWLWHLAVLYGDFAVCGGLLKTCHWDLVNYLSICYSFGHVHQAYWPLITYPCLPSSHPSPHRSYINVCLSWFTDIPRAICVRAVCWSLVGSAVCT